MQVQGQNNDGWLVNFLFASTAKASSLACLNLIYLQVDNCMKIFAMWSALS